MDKKDKKGDEQNNISIPGLNPLRSAMFRTLWIAALFSYVGITMYDVGASWLMTSLVSDPLFVSLITTATALPIFLFALPSGILSDIFERRIILLITCAYMVAISTLLGIISLIGIITPTILLILTFALGAGMTMIRTPIIPTLSGLVTRSELPAALTLSALGGNIGRVIGPTIGGFVVAAIGSWAVFFLNAAAFIGMFIILSKLPKKSNVLQSNPDEYQNQASLPPENIIRAIRVQLRYIRYSQAAHVLIVRAGLFTLCSSALLSLLPFLSRHELGLDSTGFGLILGSFGMGAIIGGIIILPRLRPRISVESLILGSIVLLSIVTFAIGYLQDFRIICIAMALGGAAYIAILSTFYTIGAKSAPKWIGARVLAIYLLVLNGGLAIGSVIWGTVANVFGIQITLSVASIALAATIIAKKRYSSHLLDDLDFTPVSDHWSLPPQYSVDPSQFENQALITIEYNKINPLLSDEFERNIHELGRLLKSEGMAYWEIFQDPADAGHYIEIRIADTWTDHIRQHEHVTKNIQIMEDKIRVLINDCPTPVISHYIGKSPLK
ncbi:MAG TPA: MFS transporter [Candidatus Saccharimonadales bacterium]|nr:MFS transporter [Candidatus Saccharimonadales bacterium]